MPKSRVLECFEKYRFTFSDPNQTEIFSQRGDSANDSFSSIIEKIQAHFHEYQDFYEQFDYLWALDSENYSCPLEAYLQLKVLRILAEANKDDEIRERFKRIVVRVVPKGGIDTQCVRIEEFTYIVVSSSYTIVLRELLYYVITLLQIGISLEPGEADLPIPSVLGGSLAAFALRTSLSECMPNILRFFCVIKQLTNNQPLMFTECFDADMLTRMGESDRLSLFTKHMIHWMEMFVICHELVHVLEHDFSTSHTRQYHLEADADYLALSLLIIHSSMTKKYEKQPEVHIGYLYGPVFSIILEHLIAEVRWTISEEVSSSTADGFYRSSLSELTSRFNEFSWTFKRMNRGRDGSLMLYPNHLVGTLTHCFHDAQAFYSGLLGRFFIKEVMRDPYLKSIPEFTTLQEMSYGQGLDWFEKVLNFILTSDRIVDTQPILITSITEAIAGMGCGDTGDIQKFRLMMPILSQGFV